MRLIASTAYHGTLGMKKSAHILVHPVLYNGRLLSLDIFKP